VRLTVIEFAVLLALAWAARLHAIFLCAVRIAFAADCTDPGQVSIGLLLLGVAVTESEVLDGDLYVLARLFLGEHKGTLSSIGSILIR